VLQLDEIYIRDLLIKIGHDEQMSRFEHIDSRKKDDGSLITDADIRSQRLIRQALAERWPEAAFLGEEMSEAEQQQAMAVNGAPLWVLDPLDGTTNYAAGIPFFGISLALIEQGEIRFGMVYDPCREECFWAERGKGAWLNGEPLRLQVDESSLAECVAVIDYKRLSNDIACALVSRPPFRSQRSLGSVALEWCWLAAGRCRLYLHGGQKLWDYAAGRLIHLEAGGAVVGEDLHPHGLKSREAVAAVSPSLLSAWVDFLDSAENAPTS
jgi:myo-inositol-1(or 4)-monophosphatase